MEFEQAIPCTTKEPSRAWMGMEHCNLRKGNTSLSFLVTTSTVFQT